MDATRYQRLKDLVHGAALRSGAERRTWLAGECGEDASLLREALSLLEARTIATRDLALEGTDATPAVLDLSPGTALGRYRLGREIGRGGMGVVYEARGESSGEEPRDADGDAEMELAVKVVLPHLLALPSVRQRFLREARLGLSLVHENVVRTLDVGEARVASTTLHFLVMERVTGRTLRRLLDELGTVPEGLLREIARQAARGLAALHRAGVVHRDLKPENLLLADDRRVRITDLGIAKVLGADASLTSEGQFVGSFRYASPEQCAGQDVGPLSDLYALGVVLYELATGRAPFDGEGLVYLMRAHLETIPMRAHERNPDVSDFLSEVVATLLAKAPAERFSSAEELDRVLQEAESGAWWTTRRRERGAPRRRVPEAAPPLPLVGRDREKTALLEAWEEAKSGLGRVVLLEGEAGVGKSRLVQEVVAEAVSQDARVLRSGFVPAGEPGGLREALASALGETDPVAEVSRRVGLAGSLGLAFWAYLRRQAPPGGIEPISSSAGETLMARLLQSFAAEGPVLWVVEDAHFAPEGSLRTVLAMARAAAGRSVLVVISSRPGLDAGFLAGLSPLDALRRVALSRLPEGDVAALVGWAVGDVALGAHLAQGIAARADGVPFFVLEIVKELERRGLLVRGEAGGMQQAAPIEPSEVPGALRDIVRARLEGLSPEERSTLDAASVQGFVFDPDLIARVRGVPRIQILETLGRLERHHGLVRSASRLCRFDHHLLQEVLYEDLAPALRAEAHGRLADVIESMPASSASAAGSSESRGATVTSHRLRGPEPEHALPSVMEALTYLDRAYRHGDALELGRRALALPALDAGADRVRILLIVAKLAGILGRTKVRTESLDEATVLVERLGPAKLKSSVWRTRAHQCLDTGDYETAILAADAAVRLAQEPGQEVARADAIGLRGQAFWCLGRHRDARLCHEEAFEIGKKSGARRVESHAAGNLAVVLHEMGFHDEAERTYRHALRIMREDGDLLNAATATMNLGNLMSDLGRKAEALASYEAALSNVRDVINRGSEAATWVNIGALRLRIGDQAGAREAFRRCNEICRETGLRREGAFALHGLGAAAEWAGDLVGARKGYEEALRVRREIHSLPGICDTLMSLGSLDVREGAYDLARARLDEAIVMADDVGDAGTSTLARLQKSFLPGEPVEPAKDFLEKTYPRLQHDAKLEARWLLWKRTGHPAYLAEAKSLLDWQLSHAPAAAVTAMRENVPHHREVWQAPLPAKRDESKNGGARAG